MNQEVDKFINLLTQAIEKLKLKGPVATVYSGGVDSSLVSFRAHQLGLKVTSFTIGFPDSPDLTFVQEMKGKLPFKAETLTLTQEILKDNLDLSRDLLKKSGLEENLMQLSLSLATQITFGEINKAKLNQALSGQAADELFGGYHRALKLKMAEINPTCKKELARLQATDAKREKAIADHYQLTIHYPFLDNDLIDYALNLDPELKLKKEKGKIIRKYLLRQAAAKLGLPKEIVNRPKAAFQYSSRVQRELIKILKKG